MSSGELLKIVHERPNQLKFILRTELAYFSHTHRADKTQRPELYKQNKISEEEKLENMCILLSSEAQASSATEAKLLTNEDGMIETIKHSKL